MKILFLDADGVCNNQESFKVRDGDGYPLRPELMERVQRIIAETGCLVVFSSAWRMSPVGRDAIKKYISLFDCTPFRPGALRGEEVRLWIEWHNDIERYAILDDNSDFYGSQPLFLTTFKDGLTEEITKKVIAHLNGDKNESTPRIQNDGTMGTGKKGTGIAPPIVGSSSRDSSSITQKAD